MKSRSDQESEVYQGKVFSLIHRRVQLPEGISMKIDIICHPGAAAIVPMLDESCVIMIRQFRHALGAWIWEIPAGTLSPREDPMECARRELVEETGFEAGCLEKVGEIIPVPDYSNDIIHIFLATNLRQVSQALEEDEILEVRKVSISSALEMIKTGVIKDAKTIIGILLVNSAVCDLGGARKTSRKFKQDPEN